VIQNTIKILKKLVLASTLFVGAIFLDSCNDDPVRVDFTQDSLNIASVSSSSFDLITSYEVYKVVNSGKLNNALIATGSADDFIVYSFIRYEIPEFYSSTFTDGSRSFTFEEISVNDIEYAKLYLYPGSYAYGEYDQNFNFDFNVYEASPSALLDSTGIITFEDVESLGGFEAWINPIPLFEGNFDLGAGDSLIIPTDSIFNPIEIEISKELIFRWFNDLEGNDNYLAALSEHIVRDSLDFSASSTISVSFRDSVRRHVADSIGFDYDAGIGTFSLGIYPNSNTNFIQHFLTRDDNRPRIDFKFTFDPDTVIRTLEPVNTVFINEEPEIPKNEFFVQGMLSRRATIDFDLSMLPENSSIVSAQLKLTIDREKSKFGHNESISEEFRGFDFPNLSLDYIILPDVDESSTQDFLTFDPLRGSNAVLFEGTSNAFYIEEDGLEKMLFPDLSLSLDLVQYGNNTSRMMFLYAYERQLSNELFIADKLVFYGPDAEDPAKRPFLNIVYQLWQTDQP
jgi:hypothetical protein